MTRFALLSLSVAVLVPCLTAADAKKAIEPPVLSERNKAALDQYLKAWDERMAKVEAVEAKVELIETERLLGRETHRPTRAGDIVVGRPNRLKLLLKDPARPSDARKWCHWVADGTHIWHYDYSNHQVLVAKQQLPVKLSQSGFWALMEALVRFPEIAPQFLFQTKAADLRERFHLTVDIDDPKRFTESYVYVRMVPKDAGTQKHYGQIELALWRDARKEYADQWMLPAMVSLQLPNDNRATMRFTEIKTRRNVPDSQFAAPKVPTGPDVPAAERWTSQWMVMPRPVAAKLERPTAAVEVWYAGRQSRVKLSPEMAAKVTAIVAKKGEPWHRELRVLPTGAFIVGSTTYSYYGGFVTSDPSRGTSWSDPVFDRFWEELNRVKDDLEKLKDFKP